MRCVTLLRWKQNSFLVSGVGFLLYSRNEDRFALIAHLMTQSTTEFFGEILQIILDGIRFLKSVILFFAQQAVVYLERCYLWYTNIQKNLQLRF